MRRAGRSQPAARRRKGSGGRSGGRSGVDRAAGALGRAAGSVGRAAGSVGLAAGSGLLRFFRSPAGLVLSLVLVVIAVGYFAQQGKLTRGADPVAGGPNGQAPGAPGSQPGQPGSQPGQPGSQPADPLTLQQQRARIDRSGGAAEKLLVTVYYADGSKNGESLLPVQIQVAKTLAVAREVVQQLIDAPQELRLFSNIPPGTKVQSVALRDGVVTVDLSPQVQQVQGSAAVSNLMASLVYSLTEFENINAVQLWVNGHKAVLHGIEWDAPITREEMAARNLFRVEPVLKYEGTP